MSNPENDNRVGSSDFVRQLCEQPKRLSDRICGEPATIKVSGRWNLKVCDACLQWYYGRANVEIEKLPNSVLFDPCKRTLK
jgi:hypothetical protein